MGIPIKPSRAQELENLEKDIELSTKLIKQAGENADLLKLRRKLNDLREELLTACGKCGGEKDSEGWCSNYCVGP